MDPNYKFKEKYNPKSNRLQNYDYSQNWGYFITICTHERQHYFGEIIDWKMIMNEYWKIVEKEILNTKTIRKNVILDDFIIMPNHVHMVIIINNVNVHSAVKTHSVVDVHSVVKTHSVVETHCNVSLQDKNKFWPQKNNLASIIRWLKWTITKQINCLWKEPYFAWQKNYYDRIIRNQEELGRIRKYILENPMKWEIDKNNTENIFM